MSGVNVRPTVPGVLGNHEERVRKLEASLGASARTFAQFDIKMFDDDEVVTNGAVFQFAVPEDINYWFFNKAAGYVSTVSTYGDVQIDVGVNRWTTDSTVLSASYSFFPIDFLHVEQDRSTSYDSAIPVIYSSGNYVISNSFDDIRDFVYVRVEACGTGAKGLGVILDFGTVDANA